MNAHEPASPGELSPEVNVYELFERRAAASPLAPAVIDNDVTTSYGELARRAADVCAFLQAQGLTPEQPIGVLMLRRAELLAVLLGI